MKRCAAITSGGERCQRTAMHRSEYCYSHDPNHSEERSASAKKAGKTGGRGRLAPLDETAQAKGYVKGIVTRLLDGTVQREIATACFMGLNVFARYIELERKIRETEEIEARLSALEARWQMQRTNRTFNR
jgi:hypothetical protein